MARCVSYAAAGLLCLALLAGSAVADEAAPAASATATGASAPRRHLLTDMPEANDDIDTVHIFPDYPEGGLPSGEQLKVLLGFRNNGESPMNVSHIAGSINSPTQFSLYVTNFTAAEYKTVVEPGKEASFLFHFQLDPQLAGHDFSLAFTAFYQDNAELYSSTFFNSTVTVLDPLGVFDTQTFFMYIALLGLVAGAVYLGLQATGMLPAAKALLKKVIGGAGGSKGSKKSGTETGTRGDNDSNEWLQGTSWTTFNAKKEKKGK